MNMVHVQPFLDAMHAKSVDKLAEHLSVDVAIYSPFVTQPFTGKDTVVGVLRALLSGVDEFEATGIIADEQRAAVLLRIRAGSTEATGVDVVTVDADGLINSMSIQWRPLEALVAIQQRLAPLIGVPVLELVQRKTD